MKTIAPIKAEQDLEVLWKEWASKKIKGYDPILTASRGAIKSGSSLPSPTTREDSPLLSYVVVATEGEVNKFLTSLNKSYKKNDEANGVDGALRFYTYMGKYSTKESIILSSPIGEKADLVAYAEDKWFASNVSI
jgi:hypothetical protein